MLFYKEMREEVYLLAFKVNRRFGGTLHLHYQCRRISQARNQLETRRTAEALLTTLITVVYFLGEGEIFLRNFD
jgi:hypothetical protein